MIIRDAIQAVRNVAPGPAPIVPQTWPEFIRPWGAYSKAGKVVSAETAKTLSTAYRCGNILSDDIARLPFQEFQKRGRSIVQVPPNPVEHNIAYLIEIQPNRWMNPFVFKKTIILWLIYYGNAYIWAPKVDYRELFILPADKTFPVFDQNGNIWYQTVFPNSKEVTLPGEEVFHQVINSTDGLSGKSVLTYARETMGRQLGAHETQDLVYSQGLNPSAALYVNGELSPEAREKIKNSYLSAVKGSSGSGGVAVFDNTVNKFEPISMTPADAQFLETTQATDAEIANFFGMPLHKINMGKQSYESNTAQQQDYIDTTLDPYLVQWEQEARLKWLQPEEQADTYFRFVREALLRMNAKERATYLKDKILSGQLSPNESRQIDDMSAYEGGDSYYIPANMAQVAPDGKLIMGAGTDTTPAKEDSNATE